MKRVILIQPTEKEGVQWAFYPPSGLLSLATVLKDIGHEVQLVDILAESLTISEVETRVRNFTPDVVGISINTMLLDSAIEIAQMVVRAVPDALLMAGGPHVTCVKEEIFAEILCLEVAVVGEAEETLPRLLEAGRGEKNYRGNLERGAF